MSYSLSNWRFSCKLRLIEVPQSGWLLSLEWLAYFEHVVQSPQNAWCLFGGSSQLFKWCLKWLCRPRSWELEFLWVELQGKLRSSQQCRQHPCLIITASSEKLENQVRAGKFSIGVLNFECPELQILGIVGIKCNWVWIPGSQNAYGTGSTRGWLWKG